MNSRFLAQVVVVLCMAVLAFGDDACADERPTNAVIPLASDVQQEIARAVTALSAGNMSEEAVQKVVQEFKGFKNKTPQELLLQVLAVYGGKEEHRSNPGAEMAKRLLLSSLLQDMTSSNIIAAVAPKYEQTADPKLQKSLRQTLDMAALKNGRVEPDFEPFSAYIVQNKDQLPRKLIQYMYGHNPQAAVMSMSRVFGGKAVETELAEKLKGDPKAVLQSFAERPEWWARLYVAETMKKRPELRDAAILKKLEKDDNPLVKEKVAEITSGKSEEKAEE